MPGQSFNPALRTPFGRNVYLRSTKNALFESYMVAHQTVPQETIDGDVVRVLQPGEVMAKITSGPYAGMIGPFQGAGTNEVQTISRSGTVTDGTFKLTFNGAETDDLPYNATATQVKDALEDAIGVPGIVTATGGPLGTSIVVTFHLGVAANVPLMTVDNSDLVGGGSVAVAETTAGVPGAADGRQTAANIVGINDTFLPWQLNERDVEVAVTYDASVVQAWCFERNAAGNRVPLTNTTRDAIVNNVPTRLIRFS